MVIWIRMFKQLIWLISWVLLLIFCYSYSSVRILKPIMNKKNWDDEWQAAFVAIYTMLSFIALFILLIIFFNNGSNLILIYFFTQFISFLHSWYYIVKGKIKEEINDSMD